MTGRPWAHFADVLATELVEIADLATDPGALDRGGWWAVVGTFEGAITGYRFDRVRPAALPPSTQWRGPDADSWTSSLDESGYRERVAVIKTRIEAGDVYQVNLCRLLTAPLPPDADPAALARVLAAGNPAPYQGVVHTGTEWLVCASPELFLARTADRVESSPIKGTAGIGEPFATKDTAENVMITDLVRNDLNRICRSDSVRVRSLLAAEEHPGLVHLVSTVIGTLRPDVGWGEILAATFPPGSVSGAPKIRALDVIGELEQVPRGPYCGAIGFVDADRGRASLAVGIRTFFTRTDAEGPRTLNFGTGAGITYPSDPHAEWLETELKARRLIGLASNAPGDTPAGNLSDGAVVEQSREPVTWKYHSGNHPRPESPMRR